MLFCLFALALPAAAAPDSLQTYTVDDIGSLGPNLPDDSHATAINNRGHVTGYYLHTNLLGFSTPRAHRWDGQNMTALSNGLSHGNAINDQDTVVGFKKGIGLGTKAHLWELTGERNLHVGALDSSDAVAINAQGEIAGSYDAEVGIPLARRQPFLVLDAVSTVTFGLPSGSHAWAMDINERGDLLGNLEQANGQPRGFLRRADGSLEFLPDLGGGAFSAMRLNNRGHVAGLSMDSTGFWHPVILSPQGLVELDALVPGGEVLILALDDQDRAVGMARNALGQEVAVHWQTDGRVEDLNHAVLGGSSWNLTRATGFNRLGEICGDGVHNGEMRGWRLSPAAVGPTITGLVGGRAGAENNNQVLGRGFRPNGDVVLYGGFAIGTSVEPLCQATLAIAHARTLGTATADDEGRFRFDVSLPIGVSGHALHLQALDVVGCGLTPRSSQVVF